MKTSVKNNSICINDSLCCGIVENSQVFNNENNIYFIVNSLKILLNSMDKQVSFSFDNSMVICSAITLSINYDMLIESSYNKIIFAKDDYNYVISSKNCLFEIDNEGYVIVRLSSTSNSFEILYYGEDDNQINFRTLSYSNSSNFVDENTYMPEFSISTYDDSSLTISRPIRQGVPIVSTVPASINNLSSSADISYYNNGKGNYYKTIYFKIICNKIMEDIAPGETSDMQLKVYMPNGLDTVKTAIYKNMTLVSTDSTNNYSIYMSSHDFYIQGNYEGIDYVDGYAYFDIQVPLTVQKIMPVEFDFIL